MAWVLLFLSQCWSSWRLRNATPSGSYSPRFLCSRQEYASRLVGPTPSATLGWLINGPEWPARVW